MIEISEEVVRGTAEICGPHSAAARAVKDAETRRAAGETVRFFRDLNVIIVHGTPVGAQVAEPTKGEK